MSNFAAVKIMRNSPLIGLKTRFTSALKTCMYEEYFQNKLLFTKQLFEQDRKASIMMRIHLNGERMALGTTGVPLQ